MELKLLHLPWNHQLLSLHQAQFTNYFIESNQTRRRTSWRRKYYLLVEMNSLEGLSCEGLLTSQTSSWRDGLKLMKIGPPLIFKWTWNHKISHQSSEKLMPSQEYFFFSPAYLDEVLQFVFISIWRIKFSQLFQLFELIHFDWHF